MLIKSICSTSKTLKLFTQYNIYFSNFFFHDIYIYIYKICIVFFYYTYVQSLHKGMCFYFNTKSRYIFQLLNYQRNPLYMSNI